MTERIRKLIEECETEFDPVSDNIAILANGARPCELSE